MNNTSVQQTKNILFHQAHTAVDKKASLHDDNFFWGIVDKFGTVSILMEISRQNIQDELYK